MPGYIDAYIKKAENYYSYFKTSGFDNTTHQELMTSLYEFSLLAKSGILSFDDFSQYVSFMDFLNNNELKETLSVLDFKTISILYSYLSHRVIETISSEEASATLAKDPVNFIRNQDLITKIKSLLYKDGKNKQFSFGYLDTILPLLIDEITKDFIINILILNKKEFDYTLFSVEQQFNIVLTKYLEMLAIFNKKFDLVPLAMKESAGLLYSVILLVLDKYARYYNVNEEVEVTFKADELTFIPSATDKHLPLLYQEKEEIIDGNPTKTYTVKVNKFAKNVVGVDLNNNLFGQVVIDYLLQLKDATPSELLKLKDKSPSGLWNWLQEKPCIIEKNAMEQKACKEEIALIVSASPESGIFAELSYAPIESIIYTTLVQENLEKTNNFLNACRQCLQEKMGLEELINQHKDILFTLFSREDIIEQLPNFSRFTLLRFKWDEVMSNKEYRTRLFSQFNQIQKALRVIHDRCLKELDDTSKIPKPERISHKITNNLTNQEILIAKLGQLVIDKDFNSALYGKLCAANNLFNPKTTFKYLYFDVDTLLRDLPPAIESNGQHDNDKAIIKKHLPLIFTHTLTSLAESLNNNEVNHSPLFRQAHDTLLALVSFAGIIKKESGKETKHSIKEAIEEILNYFTEKTSLKNVTSLKNGFFYDVMALLTVYAEIFNLKFPPVLKNLLGKDDHAEHCKEATLKIFGKNLSELIQSINKNIRPTKAFLNHLLHRSDGDNNRSNVIQNPGSPHSMERKSGFGK